MKTCINTQQKSDFLKALDVVFAELKLSPTPSSEVPTTEYSTGMPSELAETYGRAVTIALACYGNREMAYRAVDRAFEQWEESIKPGEMTYVDQVFNARIANFLSRNGIETIADLSQQNRSSLAMLGFEFKTVVRIEADLERIGFSLRTGEI